MKGIPELEKKVQAVFDKVKVNPQMRDEMGDFLVTRIRGEARRGKPLNNTRSFPELADSTKIIRQVMEDNNITHPAYKYDRSNLTFTGQLIDAIVFELSKAGITIFVDNTRRFPLVPPRMSRGLFKTIGTVVRGAGGNQFATTAIVRNVRDQKEKTNAQVDKDLRKRGFDLYTVQGIASEQRIAKRLNNIAKKYVRRAIKINFES